MKAKKKLNKKGLINKLHSKQIKSTLTRLQKYDNFIMTILKLLIWNQQ